MSGYYCKPEDHIWVRVVAGKTYDPDFETDVCIKCECHSSTAWTAATDDRAARPTGT